MVDFLLRGEEVVDEGASGVEEGQIHCQEGPVVEGEVDTEVEVMEATTVLTTEGAGLVGAGVGHPPTAISEGAGDREEEDRRAEVEGVVEDGE